MSDSIKRRVRVYTHEHVPEEGIPEHLWEKRLTPDYEGDFLGWGQESEQYEMGGASYTCAIVEKDDGFVTLVYAHQVQFLNPAKAPRKP